MSRIISSESFRKIEPLISDNYSNVYARMRMKLTPDELSLFARPDFPQPNMGQWICDLNENLRSFNQANDREKEEIAVFLEKMKREITPKLAGNANLKYIFEIPSTDQIFWWRDSQGKIHCMLSQWGFHMFNAPQNVNVIDILINMPRRFTQTDVVVHVRYSDGMPAANATFQRFLFNNDSDFTTDANGNCDFGEMVPGQRFSVYDRTGRHFDYEVLDGVSDYNAEFEFLTSYRINVVNQYDESMPGVELIVDNQRSRTDAQGAVEIHDVVLTPNKVVKVSAPNIPGATPAEFRLSRDIRSNVFFYKVGVEEKTDFDIKVINQDGAPKSNYPLIVNGEQMFTGSDGLVRVNEWSYQRGVGLEVVTQDGMLHAFNLSLDPARNHFTIELHEPIYTSYSIKVVNQRGQEKPNYPINVDTIQMITNEDGMVICNNVLWQEGMTINVSSQGGGVQQYTVQRDPNYNNFIYQINEVIQAQQKVRIQVLDYDKTPLDNLMVSIKSRNGQLLNAMTDNQGFVEFPANAFEDGKKTKVDFTITKSYRKALEERKRQQRNQNQTNNNGSGNNRQ